MYQIVVIRRRAHSKLRIKGSSAVREIRGRVGHIQLLLFPEREMVMLDGHPVSVPSPSKARFRKETKKFNTHR